jgi:hypothetical protein
MAQELNLDQLSDAMRRQQEGDNSGKRIVWDKNTMTFKELGNSEAPTDEQSPVNDVSQRPFFA